MNDDESTSEAARAASEARDAVVGRTRGSKRRAIEAALRRYLSAETYEEERRARHESDGDDEERPDESP